MAFCLNFHSMSYVASLAGGSYPAESWRFDFTTTMSFSGSGFPTYVDRFELLVQLNLVAGSTGEWMNGPSGTFQAGVPITWTSTLYALLWDGSNFISTQPVGWTPGVSMKASPEDIWYFNFRSDGGAGGSCFTQGPQYQCYEPTVVPEPGTVLLLATGLLGVGFVTWRRRGRYKA